MKPKVDKSTIIVVLILLLIAAIGVFSLMLVIVNEKDTLVELPTINVKMVSDSDSKSHDVNAKFAVIADSTINDETRKEINDTITEAIKGADYEAMVGKGGFEYTKNIVKEKLNEKYGENISDIYVGQFSCDLVQIDKEETEQEKERDNAMNSLFPNMK